MACGGAYEGLLATGGMDGLLKVWDLQGPRLHVSCVCVCVSVCVCVRMCGNRSRCHQLRGEFHGNHKQLSSVEWLEGSSLVVGLGGHLTVWDASARSSVASFAHRRGPLVAAIPMARRAFCHHGHHNTTSGNSFLLGDCHALAVATQASLCVLDVRTVSASASVAAEWQLSRVRGSRSGTADPVGAFGGVQCMCMVGNHNAIAVGSATGNVAVVDRRTGALLYSWNAHGAPIVKLAALDNGQLLSVSADESATTWDLSASGSDSSVSAGGAYPEAYPRAPPTTRAQPAPPVPSWKAASVSVGTQRWAVHEEVRGGWHKPVLAPVRTLGSDVRRVSSATGVLVPHSSRLGSANAFALWHGRRSSFLLSAASNRFGFTPLTTTVCQLYSVCHVLACFDPLFVFQAMDSPHHTTTVGFAQTPSGKRLGKHVLQARCILPLELRRCLLVGGDRGVVAVCAGPP